MAHLAKQQFDTKDVTFIASGKTKSIYKFNKDDQYVLVISNSSITAGDGAKRDELPGKGTMSTTTTCNVFRILHLAGVNTHYIRQEENNSFIAKKCSMIPLEVIVRRLATGSYLKRNPHIAEGTKFNPCLIEFTFKDDVQHDPLVTEPDILKMDLKIGGVPITSKILSNIRHIANLAFEAVEKAWASIDVVLVDFKVEFGITPQGELILADVIDNDSWRIWPHGDKKLMRDKQVYRNIPVSADAPKVGTLTEDQTRQLIENYSWVADSTSKMVDFMINHNMTTPTPTRANYINSIMSPQPSPTPQHLLHHGHHHHILFSNHGNISTSSGGVPIQSNLPPYHQSQPPTPMLSTNQPIVGVIMGSQSDWDTMKLAANTLLALGVPYETKIVSAHRTPDRLFEYAKSAKSRGLKVIIAGAGGAAHLPGMVAALTPLPVFGVPVQSKTLSGVDSLLSIVQMPAGIPVGTVAIGAAGATNAAILAASALATFYPSIEQNLDTYRKNQTNAVADSPTDSLPSSSSSHSTSNISASSDSTTKHHHHQHHTNDVVSNLSSLMGVQHQQQQQQTQQTTQTTSTQQQQQPPQISTPSSSSSNITQPKPVQPIPILQTIHSPHQVSTISSPTTGIQSPIRSASPLVSEKGPLSTFVLSSIKSSSLVLPPGSTIGILGGGQLARMIIIAAAQLGYKTHVFCPENDPSASHVATYTTKSNYNNYSQLDLFASKVDVVTYEFENILVEPVDYLSKKVAVFPDPKVLRICQDRVQEKRFVQSLDIPTASFEPVDSLQSLKNAVAKIGFPSILKSNTMGYDGKGQIKLTDSSMDLEAAWKKVTGDTNTSRAILEKFIEFESEASVIVARSLDSNELSFPLVSNNHRNHILRQTIAPAPLPEQIHKEAREIASKIAKGIGLIGVLAVELFVVKVAGEDGKYQLMVNELAPRPHNSGHWTIEGCVTSQFEQLVRCICGLPLGSVDIMKRIPEKEYLQDPQNKPIIMNNLLGAEVDNWEKHLSHKGSHLHLYAKGDAREGRKMGHVTIIP